MLFISGSGHQESPFFSIWYVNCAGKEQTKEIYRRIEMEEGCKKVRSWQGLKDNGFVPVNVRPNPRKRKALKKKLLE
jgi:hypothetical protein